jgi:predicted nuclease of predicted toxin-antitoxin system
MSSYAVAGLRAAGHDVIWSAEWDTDPGDLEILKRANEEQRVLVTLDKDFGELAIVRNIPHSGIIRIVNAPATKQGEICIEVISKYEDVLLAGGIVTVEPDRIRVRSDKND